MEEIYAQWFSLLQTDSWCEFYSCCFLTNKKWLSYCIVRHRDTHFMVVIDATEEMTLKMIAHSDGQCVCAYARWKPAKTIAWRCCYAYIVVCNSENSMRDSNLHPKMVVSTKNTSFTLQSAYISSFHTGNKQIIYIFIMKLKNINCLKRNEWATRWSYCLHIETQNNKPAQRSVHCWTTEAPIPHS